MFAITSHKNENIYNAILDKVIEIVPNLVTNVKHIHLDFEPAAIKSFKNKIPNAETHGCSFHYKQVIKSITNC